MSAEHIRLLLIEDADDDAALVIRQLGQAGYAVDAHRVETEAATATALADAGWDLVIADFSMPAFNGLRALEMLRARGLDTPFIFVSGTIGEDAAVAAMRAGAQDYVSKQDLRRLAPAVERELREAGVRRERRRTAKALRRSELRMRRLLDSNILGVLLWRRNGEIFDANDAFLHMLGLSRADLEAGRIDWRRLTPPAFAELTEQRTTEILTTGSCRPFEKEFFHADGHRVPVLIGGVRLDDDTGDAISIVHDLSEIRRVTHALAEASEMRRSILEATPLPVIVLDPDGLVRVWNPAAERVFGWTAEEVMDKPNPALPPGGVPEARARVEQALAGATWEGLNARRLTRDGDWVDVREFTAPTRDVNGTITGVVKVFEDIREALRLEAQLRHAQRLEAVGLLAGGIAHDFNNLLTVILGEVEFVQLADSPGDAVESLAAIQNAAQRASLLTRQLLTFSKRQLIDPKPVDVNRIVNALHQMIVRLIGEDIRVTLRLQPGACSVVADAGQLEQIVMNLVINARDAMPEGGTLVIETSEAELEEPKPGRYVGLTVRDTGIGMSEDVRNRIFDAFFTTKGAGKGTGLGLATCQDIVVRAGGRIDVESAPGQGTAMRVYLPRTTETAPTAPDRNASLPGGDETILLVEDDAGVRTVTTRMLAPLGYTVIATENGEQALAMLTLHQRTIDLLLTDLVLPGMSGRVVAERARQVRPDLKVLFASGYTDDVIVQRQLLEHGASFLQKPFTPRALGEKVREVLDQS